MKIAIFPLNIYSLSLAANLKDQDINNEITGIDTNTQILNIMLEKNFIDKTLLLGDKTDTNFDFIFCFSQSPSETVDLLQKLQKNYNNSTVILENTLVKEKTSLALEEADIDHPIIHMQVLHNTAETNPLFARGDFFKQVVISIVGENDEENLNNMRAFWKKLGALIIPTSTENHDEIIASTLQVPFIFNIALATTLLKDSWAETRFLDLYNQILLDSTQVLKYTQNIKEIANEMIDNRQNLTGAIGRSIDELTYIQKLLEKEDHKKLEKYIQTTIQFRDKL